MNNFGTMMYILIFITVCTMAITLTLRHRISKVALFCTILIVGNLLFWGSVIISQDPTDQLQKYFMPGTLDDFFTPMMKYRENTYVAPHYSDYPALPNLLYLLFKRFIPNQDILTANSMETRLEGAHYLSTTMGGTLLPLLFYIASFIALYMVLDRLLENKLVPLKRKLIIGCICLSGPFLFIVQRGNNIIIPIVLTFFFLDNYRSENKVLRELAIISLALATAFKIYPVLFGLLLIRQSDWKLTLRAIIYGVIAMFGPFIFYDGLDSVGQFLQNLFMRNEYKESTIYGYNYSVSFLTSARIIVTAFTGTELTEVPTLLHFIPIVICGLLFIAAQEEWQRICAITLAMMWIPSASYTYLLCFFTYPFCILLSSKELKSNSLHTLLIATIGIMFTPYGLSRLTGFFAEAQSNLQLTVGMIIVHTAIWFFVVFLSLCIVRPYIERGLSDPY